MTPGNRTKQLTCWRSSSTSIFTVPRELDVHVVLDNLSAYKAPEITTWLADPKRARWHLHFIPTSSSWLNLVEC